MRDIVLYVHIIIGVALIVFPIVILFGIQKRASWLKLLSTITALLSWLLLVPAGKLYLTFYPATKTLIKAGAWPWAHLVVMETKEHLGLLLPIIATVATGLVFSGKTKASKRWWILLAMLTFLLGVMGRIVTLGGTAR